MSQAGDCSVGSKVRVAAGDGIVRWIGTNPDFATGKWVGVELFEANGKNDGSVQGKPYFRCKPKYGVFVRPSQVRNLEDDEPLEDGSISRPESRSISRGQTTSRPDSSLSQSGPDAAGLSSAIAPPSRPMSQVAAVSNTQARRSVNQSRDTTAPSNNFANRLSRTSSVTGRAVPVTASTSLRNLAAIASVSDNTLSSEHSQTDASPTPSPDGTPTPAPRNAMKDGVFKKPTALTSVIHANRTEHSMATAEDSREQRPQQSQHVPTRPLSSVSSHADNTGLSRSRPVSAMSRASSRMSDMVDSAHDTFDDTRKVPQSQIQGIGPGGTRDAMSAIARKSELMDQGGSSTGISIRSRVNQPPSTVETRPDLEALAKLRATSRELEEIKIRLKLMENRRSEDAERIMGLEARAIEAETRAQNFDKLRTKFIEVQQENASLKRSKREMESVRGDFEGKETELLEQLEMAALDREVAEEKAETLMTELADMKELVETLKIEVEVLKEENAVYDTPVQPGEEHSKLAFIQLEKRSERLAEALFKLQSENKLQQSRISELERQGDATNSLQARLLNANMELENAQLYIDDLKQQLDNALGAEEMLEQLTDRTLSMGEKIEEMRITIEDLEALKEMADELEENHIENERQLEEQISVLTSRLNQEARQAEQLVEALADRDSTIEQFRELVSRFQDEIHALRDQEGRRQEDNLDSAAQSQVVLNLNLKLQTSAIKNRARAVDLALSKLELDQAKEHAAIMHQYLPDQYFLADAAATEALLFLQRLAGKAELLIKTFCEIHKLPDALQEARDDALVGVCELRGSLSEFVTFTRRFAGIMRRSTSEEYISLAPVRLELSAIERKVDSWFDQIRRDEFVEKDCAEDLHNFLAQLGHLAQAVFNREDLDAGERQLGFALAFDYDLDNFAAAVGFARHTIERYMAEPDAEFLGESSTFEHGIVQPVQRILDQVHLVKASSLRLIQIVETVQKQSLALNSDEQTALRMLASSVTQATDIAIQLAQKIGQHVAELRMTKEPLQLPVILGFLQELTSHVTLGTDVQPWDVIGMFVTRLSNDVNALLPQVQQSVTDQRLITISVEPPWIARVKELAKAASVNMVAEAKSAQQAEQITTLLKEVKIRDQTLQDSNVKIQLLQRKADAGKQRADAVEKLQTDLQGMKRQHEDMELKINSLRQEVIKLETENSALQRLSKKHEAAITSPVPKLLAETAFGSDPGLYHSRVERLQAALQVLRNENAQLKARGLMSTMSELPMLSHLPPIPDLDSHDSRRPCSPSSSDDVLLTPVARSRATRDVNDKALWREMMDFQTAATVIDISKVKPGTSWIPMKCLPEVQLYEQETRGNRLRRQAEQRTRQLRCMTR